MPHGLTQPPGFQETAALLTDPDLLLIAIKATQPDLDVCEKPCALDPDSDCMCWTAPDDHLKEDQ